MTMLKAVSAIQTSDGALFSEAEYDKAVRHEKMVLAELDYQNIMASGYLREYLDGDKFDNTIDFLHHEGTIHFAKALLLAFSDYKQAMNEDINFCDSLDESLVEGDEYAIADELGDTLPNVVTDPAYNPSKELAELVSAKKPSKPKKAAKQPKPEKSNDADPLYLEAVELVRSGDIRPSGKALREKFGIRNDRASKIMSCMVADGVVSEQVKGVRTVL